MDNIHFKINFNAMNSEIINIAKNKNLWGIMRLSKAIRFRLTLKEFIICWDVPNGSERESHLN